MTAICQHKNHVKPVMGMVGCVSVAAKQKTQPQVIATISNPKGADNRPAERPDE